VRPSAGLNGRRRGRVSPGSRGAHGYRSLVALPSGGLALGSAPYEGVGLGNADEISFRSILGSSWSSQTGSAPPQPTSTLPEREPATCQPPKRVTAS
jgi:hypothetical protein